MPPRSVPPGDLLLALREAGSELVRLLEQAYPAASVQMLSNLLRLVLWRAVALAVAARRGLDLRSLATGHGNGLYAQLHQLFGLPAVELVALEGGDEALLQTLARLDAPPLGSALARLDPPQLIRLYEQLARWSLRREAGRLLLDVAGTTHRSGGVYYTPEPVVAYIVARTLGPLREREEQARRSLRLVDPACGAGAFLLGAYAYLLREQSGQVFRDTAHDEPEIAASPGVAGASTRRQLLLESIHGVDIDPLAAEACRFVLALKSMETGPASAQELVALLAALSNTVRGGDALLGGGLDEGSFDVVVGNPPYLNAVEGRTRAGAERKAQLRQHFVSARGAVDASVLFQELGLRLLAEGGRCGMIVPNKVLAAPYGAAFRRYALAVAELRLLADFSRAAVFPGLAVYPVVCVLERRGAPRPRYLVEVETYTGAEEPWRLLERRAPLAEPACLASWSELFSHGGGLLVRLAQLPPLGALYHVAASAAAAEAYELRSCLSDQPSGAALIFLTSGAIERYHHTHGRLPARYLKASYGAPYLPLSCPRLSEQRRRQYRAEKLLVAGMTRRLEAIWDPGQAAGAVSTIQVLRRPDTPAPALKYILALLNSTLMSWIFRQHFGALALSGGYLRVGVPQISALPLRPLDLSSPPEHELHQQAVELVDAMLALHQALALAPAAQREPLLGRLAELDRQIDALVYQLYGLSEAEIALVEAEAIRR